MIVGNKIKIPTRTRSDAKKGMTPLKVSIIGTSFAIELMMKTFRPTGGVIRPISTTISEMMPNHNLASSGDIPKSSPAMIGQKIGTVRKIIERESITKPSRM